MSKYNSRAMNSGALAVSDFKSNLKVRQFRYHIEAAGAALAQSDIIRMMKLPADAVIADVHMKWEAGGGTNTLTLRYGKVSDDSVTHVDLKTNLTGGSAGYFRLSDETAAATNVLVEPGYESYIEIELAGANGWAVDKYIKGAVFYYTPSFDDEITDADD